MDRPIRTDNDTVINANYIRWIRRVADCMHVCSRFDGCAIGGFFGDNTHKVCKSTNPENYKRLEALFTEK